MALSQYCSFYWFQLLTKEILSFTSWSFCFTITDQPYITESGRRALREKNWWWILWAWQAPYWKFGWKVGILLLREVANQLWQLLPACRASAFLELIVTHCCHFPQNTPSPPPHRPNTYVLRALCWLFSNPSKGHSFPIEKVPNPNQGRKNLRKKVLSFDQRCLNLLCLLTPFQINDYSSPPGNPHESK